MSTEDKATNNPIEESVDFLAKKFSLLLATSDLSEERQKEIIEKLPSLELEEMVDLVAVLEADYTNSQTSALDVELERKLEAIAQTLSKQEQSYDDELLKKLSDLEQQLD